MHFYIVRGEFEKGAELIKEIDVDINHYQGTIPKEIELSLFINIALIYFGLDNFSKTLPFLNKILSESVTNVRNDIVCFARILNLITHFELGNINA